jgi:hypothetical protein
MKRFTKLVSIAAAATLAGCGSESQGGPAAPYIDIGYTGPTTAIAITSTDAVAATVSAGGASLGGFSGAADTGAIAVAAPKERLAAKAALAALGRHHLGAGAVVAGVTSSGSQPCAVSGSISFSSTMADSTGETLAAGDTMSVSFNACDDGYGVTAGTMTVRIDACPDNAYMLDPSMLAPGVTYGMTMTISDFVSVDELGYYAGIDGDETVSMVYTADGDGIGGWLTTTVSGDHVAFEEGYDGVAASSARIAGIGTADYWMESGEHFPYDPSDFPDATSSALSVRLCSTELGGCVNVETSSDVLVDTAQLYPYAGTITYSDDAGHYVEVTATNGATGAVTIYYDIGAGRVGPIDTTSACLEQADTSGCFPPP